MLGAPAGSIDDAVRRTYESWGYGPGYKLPGLSHRTGHGIGLEGHEPINLVRGLQMMHVEDGYAMVHAGLLPSWSVPKALDLGHVAQGSEPQPFGCAD